MNEDELTKEKIIEHVIEYLNTHRILTMATATKDGFPDATALEYANRDLNVYVSVRIGSQKISNIRENPIVFYEIHEDIEINLENIKNLKAIQILAEPEIIFYKEENVKYEDAFQIMLSKFPVFKQLNKEKRAILLFKPKKIWFLNYRKKFFHRDEVEF